MGSVRVRASTQKLFFDFKYRGKRCREQTALDNTPANRKKLEAILKRIEAEITLGTFEYHKYFPDSPRSQEFTRQAELQRARTAHDTPLFSEFSQTWLDEMRIQWRRSYIATIEGTLENYLIPEFGESEVGHITRQEILSFRASLAKVETRSKKPLSASRECATPNTRTHSLTGKPTRHTLFSFKLVPPPEVDRPPWRHWAAGKPGRQSFLS